jgi:hypothetical protein
LGGDRNRCAKSEFKVQRAKLRVKSFGLLITRQLITLNF